MSRRDDSKSASKRRSPQVAGVSRALPRPNITVKEYEEPPMPPEQRERLEKLAEVVQDMQLGRAEDERERRYEEAMRKRDVSSMRRRLQKEMRKSSQEVRSREGEAAEIRREVRNLEREEENMISRKLRRDEKFEDGFNKVKNKEMEKNLLRLTKRSEAESQHEKLALMKASLRTLEQDQIRAIADAERGVRTRSSSRATQVLEFEVEELRRESDRLDEENLLLRQELESYGFSTFLAEAPRVTRTASEKNTIVVEASRRGVMTSPGRMAARQKEPLDNGFGHQLGASTGSLGSFSATAPPAVRTHSVQASASAPVLAASSLPGSAAAPSSPPLQSAKPIELISRPAELVAPSRFGTSAESTVPAPPAYAWGATSLAKASSRQSLEASPSYSARSNVLPLSPNAVLQPPMRLASSDLRLASPSSVFRSTSSSPIGRYTRPAGSASVAAPSRRMTPATPTRLNTTPLGSGDPARLVIRAVPGGVATVSSPMELRAAPQQIVSSPARSPALAGTRLPFPPALQAVAAGPWLQPVIAPPIRA